MLFPTIRFAIFFALVLPASWWLMPRQRWWKLFIVLASFVFYASWDAGYVVLLAGSIVANQLLASFIHWSHKDRWRNFWTAVAVAANLGVLGWFKYAGFLTDSATTALEWFGITWHVSVPNVMLPVGISFFTFQALSYVIDVRRRLITPSTMLDFAAYLSFFPHLVAGPIVRARELLPQLRVSRDPRSVNVGLAFWLICAGLVKKVVIASYLADVADSLFAVPREHGGLEALVALYAYALQIYADFSGYTDMAIGIAMLLGFSFPANFDAPYTATSLRDFWRRWHMTLSRFLRDYLYIPLGGNRGGRRRMYRNLMITMLLGGLWHGAAWTFVIWGALHGGGLVFEHWWVDRKKEPVSPIDWLELAEPQPSEPPTAPAHEPGRGWSVGPPNRGSVAVAVAAQPEYRIRGAARARLSRLWVQRIVTFNVVCLAWVFFRAGSVSNAFAVLDRILFHFHGDTHDINPWVVGTIVGMLAMQLVPPGLVAKLQARWARWSVPSQAVTLAAVLLVVDVLGPTGVAPFIYFQF